jgi:DNA processing protein
VPNATVDLEPLLRLSLVPGVGPQRLDLLIRHFGSAGAALRAGAREVAALRGLGPAVVRHLREAAGPAARERTRAALALLDRMEVAVLTPADAAYPEAFRALPDAPYLLFACGDPGLLAHPAVAVVGTRTPSPYGRAAAASLAGGLAREGFAIASGMAKGIDAVAHAAALDANGASIGVLGSGIDQVYPFENRALFARMREEGLLLTEYPPGETPRAGNFPRRNRLITALGRAVLVVEMGLRSGAQHTVNYALEQGREVLAVPGPIGTPTSAGTNQLIRDGAAVVTSLDDVLEHLHGVGAVPTAAGSARGTRPAPPGAARAIGVLSAPAVEPGVLGALAGEPRHIDDLCATTGLPAGHLLASLLELELGGRVEALPGKRFRRV